MQGTMLGPVLKNTGAAIFTATMHPDAGDPKHQEGAWGDILGNLTVLGGMMFGMHELSEPAHTRTLDATAHSEYESKFTDLTKEQKVNVLWKSLETENPEFKARVDKEYRKIVKQKGIGGNPVGEEVKEDRDWRVQKIQEQQARTRAAQNVMNQAIMQHFADEAYKTAQANAEYQVRKADAFPPKSSSAATPSPTSVRPAAASAES